MNRLGPLLLLAVLGSGCAQSASPPSAEPQSAATTTPSDDGATDPLSGLVGLAGVTLTTPESWSSVVYDGCARVPDRTVVFRLDAATTCDRALDRKRSWISLERLDRDDSILLVMDRGPRLGEERTRRTGLACRASTTRECDQTMAVPGLGVLIQLHLVGREARRELVSLRDSLGQVEDGYVAVPPLAYGTSDAEASRILSEAELVARIPEVDWPHYVTTSEPPAGSIVEVGSVIDLLIGDG